MTCFAPIVSLAPAPETPVESLEAGIRGAAIRALLQARPAPVQTRIRFHRP